MNKNPSILIVDTSSLIFEGFRNIVHRSGLDLIILKAGSLEDIGPICTKKNIDLIIINPAMIQYNLKMFHVFKHQFENVKWAGLVYTYFDQNLLSLFDSLISISDSSENILATTVKLLNSEIQRDQNNKQDVLSDRETEVLLATGMSNKEIADKLNISTNTVITHRKNVTQKTGIKSVSGLTIYAVVQKIITIE